MTCHDRENMPLNMFLKRRFPFCNAILLCAQLKFISPIDLGCTIVAIRYMY